MNDEKNILICAHLSHGIPGSILETCAQCGCKVWVAPSGQRTLRIQAPMMILCMTCGLAKIRADRDVKVEPIRPDQMREIADYFGRN
jgi:hypothetical protein